MGRLEDKRCKALRRKKRIRKKINGTAERPRLTVHKSLRNIRVQVIDDSQRSYPCSSFNSWETRTMA